MDFENFQPHGPWVLVKTEPVKKKEGSLFVPDGNMMERLGHSVAVVLKVGPGKLSTKKKPVRKYDPIDLTVGDRVVFRGHLSSSNPLHALDRDHVLLHVDDIVGVLGEDSELSLACANG